MGSISKLMEIISDFKKNTNGFYEERMIDQINKTVFLVPCTFVENDINKSYYYLKDNDKKYLMIYSQMPENTEIKDHKEHISEKTSFEDIIKLIYGSQCDGVVIDAYTGYDIILPKEKARAYAIHKNDPYGQKIFDVPENTTFVAYIPKNMPYVELREISSMLNAANQIKKVYYMKLSIETDNHIEKKDLFVLDHCGEKENIFRSFLDILHKQRKFKNVILLEYKENFARNITRNKTPFFNADETK